MRYDRSKAIPFLSIVEEKFPLNEDAVWKLYSKMPHKERSLTTFAKNSKTINELLHKMEWLWEKDDVIYI